MESSRSPALKVEGGRRGATTTQTTTYGGLDVKYLPPMALKPYPRNARTYSKKKMAQVPTSIRSLGFNMPILVDEHNTVPASHARHEAAKMLALETMRCVRLSHMSKVQKKTIIINGLQNPFQKQGD